MGPDGHYQLAHHHVIRGPHWDGGQDPRPHQDGEDGEFAEDEATTSAGALSRPGVTRLLGVGHDVKVRLCLVIEHPARAGAASACRWPNAPTVKNMLVTFTTEGPAIR